MYKLHAAYLHHKLVGSADECEAIVVVEVFRDVLAEGVAGPARGYSPAAPVVRIRPQQVTHGPLQVRAL